MTQAHDARPHRIVIVGGGAGGLELATRLGRRHGRRGTVEVVLVDRTRTHMWKPLLHAVAAGSLNIHEEQIDYLYQARWNHFEYCRGAMTGLDRGHLMALHGFWKTALDTVTGWMRRQTDPHVKLH